MQELIERINERKIKLWIGLDGELHYRAPKGALSPELAGHRLQGPAGGAQQGSGAALQGVSG